MNIYQFIKGLFSLSELIEIYQYDGQLKKKNNNEKINNVFELNKYYLSFNGRSYANVRPFRIFICFPKGNDNGYFGICISTKRCSLQSPEK
jgi:hypothetical protein